MGAQKSAVLTKKAWVENSKTGERSLLGPKKRRKGQKKAEKLRFFSANPCFFGKKKHGKGDQGIEKPILGKGDATKRFSGKSKWGA